MTFADILKAGEMAVTHAASMVYHELTVVTTDVQHWEEANPAVAALLQKGVMLAEGWLTAHGIPVSEVTVLETDVLAMLKQAAVADAAVPSPQAKA